MDSLSVKFLQLHQEKIVVTNYTQWDSTTNKSTILPWKNNWLKIEISDSIDNSLNNCFLLFKDYINKNLVNNYSYWEQKWISIVLDSINLINYAQKINKSEIVSNLKEYLITDLVIKYAEKNIDQIKKIKSGSLKFSKKVFIRIEYSDKYNNTKEIIKKTIIDASLVAIILNEQEHNDIIDNKLYEEMNNCDFGIFDISADNSNVAFEAGYMLGKGKEIILICDNNYFKEIKFDFNHRNIVKFRDAKELKEKLEKRLYSIITKNYI